MNKLFKKIKTSRRNYLGCPLKIFLIFSLSYFFSFLSCKMKLFFFFLAETVADPKCMSWEQDIGSLAGERWDLVPMSISLYHVEQGSDHSGAWNQAHCCCCEIFLLLLQCCLREAELYRGGGTENAADGRKLKKNILRISLRTRNGPLGRVSNHSELESLRQFAEV